MSRLWRKRVRRLLDASFVLFATGVHSTERGRCDKRRVNRDPSSTELVAEQLVRDLHARGGASTDSCAPLRGAAGAAAA